MGKVGRPKKDKSVEASAKVGRPAKYSTPKELQRKIDEYFDYCDNHTKIGYNDAGEEITIHDPIPYTNSGLVLYLGFSSRQSLFDYQEKEEFSDIIKRARLKLEAYNENCLYTLKNVTGVIFQLKANYGWQDKIVVDQNVNIKTKLEDFFNDESDNV